jgi:hypothetical protein
MAVWTTAESRRVEQLLNKRFANGYKTVLLTNLTNDELWSRISAPLRSRLLTGRTAVLTGEDLRENPSDVEDF